uniref:Reverse transcriptase domain-containing protein n=1 Tax=Lactuca sativa TaxID=4236 RepID=A0A9R1W320_LACSA|nr:hypothetical protein LSAT_V11C300103160 [Lactuca sativa]
MMWGKFSRGCYVSFITLVVKSKEPLRLVDYRPISLIGSMVTRSVINEVQSAFVEGLNILEGHLIVNEICSWAKANGKEILFKTDFNNVFDSINWGYLESIMAQTNFACKWRSWIQGCLKLARASIIINGSPTSEFTMSKGVRQGDPLSPFLFIFTMGGLNIALKSVTSKGIFDEIRIPCSNIFLSHLLYVDDALFLGEWSKRNIVNLARILRCFYVSSVLKVNFNKSKVYGIVAPTREVVNWEIPLGCEPSSLPFTYLGFLNPILAKLKAKLSVWKAKSLSFGGRITLAKVVLGSLPTFCLSIRCPDWSPTCNNSINWVAWENIVSPKGGGWIRSGIHTFFELSITN